MPGLSQLQEGSWKGGLFRALVGTEEIIVIFFTWWYHDNALLNTRVINKHAPRFSFYGTLTFVAVLTTAFLRALY
jgi:hypothetical protein